MNSEIRRRWFPLVFALVEQAAFKRLPARKKVILLDIYFRVSEHLGLFEQGWRATPHFTEPDKKWAARLCVSLQCFRDARCELGRNVTGKTKSQGQGWFTYRPGYQDHDEKLHATEYQSVLYGRVKRGEGIRCAPLDRHTWAFLIAGLTKKTDPLEHSDLAAYLAVAHLWELCGGSIPGKGKILISKNEIRPLTGIPVGVFMHGLARLSSLGLLKFHTAKQSRQWAVEIADWRPIPKEGTHGSL